MALRFKAACLGITTALSLAAAGATIALAQASGEQAVKERSELMKSISANNKIVAAAAKSGEIDAKAIKAAEDISAAAKKIPALFPQGTGDDKLRTRAKPAIWQEWPKFEANAKKLESGFGEVAAAAKAGNKEQFQTSFKEASAACGACHKPYRGPELK